MKASGRTAQNQQLILIQSKVMIVFVHLYYSGLIQSSGSENLCWL